MHVTVQENGDKQALNTPGGEALMDRLGGKGSSIPFFAFLDSRGELIVNSIGPNAKATGKENIGHPIKPHEVAYFLAMLREAVPQMAPEETAILEKWLRAQKQSP